MKKLIALLLVIAMVASFTAASAQEATGKAQGFGGEITVTLNVEDGKVVAAKVVGDDETPALGGRAVEQIKLYP